MLSVSEMRSLFSRTSPAYVQITLKEIYAVWKNVMGLHDKVFEISQRKLKMGGK